MAKLFITTQKKKFLNNLAMEIYIFSIDKKMLFLTSEIMTLKMEEKVSFLSPIFHQLIATKLKIDLPVCILNIGGIANISIIEEPFGSNNFSSKDIGPGNCLIDSW